MHPILGESMHKEKRPMQLASAFWGSLGFIDTEVFVVVAQALFETRFYLPSRFTTTAQGKLFSTYIAANSHFCSLVL